MSAQFAVVMLLAGDDTAVMMTSGSETECLIWLKVNGAGKRNRGGNYYETEDGIVYEIRREVAW